MRNLPIILYLIAIPLISFGSTGGNPALTWLGFGALLFGGAITPSLRFAPSEIDGTTHDVREEKEDAKDG
jgi:hypothetical protein